MSEDEKCPECNGTHVVKDDRRAELVCDDCGLIVQDRLIDGGPEWRDYPNDESRSRVGPPMTSTRHDKGLSTEISLQNRDSQGKHIPYKSVSGLYRMRKWHARTKVDKSQRNLVSGLQEIERLTGQLDLSSNIGEEAAIIYRHAAEKGIFRGRSIELMATASVYAACRNLGVPRTLDEIIANKSCSRKEIGRYFRTLNRELKLELVVTDPKDYIPRFCSELNLSQKVQTETYRILDKSKTITGHSPPGVAAATIYIAASRKKEYRTQRQVAEVAGVTEVTVRNRYKEIELHSGISIQH